MTAAKYTGIEDLGNNRYRVRVYDPRTRKYLQERIEGIVAARRRQAQLKADVQRDVSPVRRGVTPTVEQFAEAWRRELLHAPTTAVNFESLLRSHVYPVLGHYRVDRVAHREALMFRRLVATSDMAVSMQGRVDSAVRQVFSAIVAEGWREQSPFAKVPRIAVPKRAARRVGEYVPSLAEALFLADLALEERRPDVWAFIRTVAGTGMRGGEACGLAVHELDYPAPTRIELGQQLIYISRAFHLGPPKTEAGVRSIPLATWVADTLAVLSAVHRPHRVALPWVERGRERGERIVELLFSGRYGPAPLQETVMARAVRSLAARAGMPGRVTPHSLRRTYTTLLHDAGVPIRSIDYVTGHESTGLTVGVYTEVTRAGLEHARRATQEAFEAATTAVAKAS